MSTISEYLKQILSARYGKDVRQAIHDGIKQCYDDGRSGSIDLMARNQIEALNKSMIDMSSEVGDRIKYTDVVDNLESTEADKPLSANQGKALNDAIGKADISAIGDGTVKGAILANSKIRIPYNQESNIDDIINENGCLENHVFGHSEALSERCGYWVFVENRAYGFDSQVVQTAIGEKGMAWRFWNRTNWTDWNSFLPLTGGVLSSSELGLYGGYCRFVGDNTGVGIATCNTPNDKTNHRLLRMLNNKDKLNSSLLIRDFIDGARTDYTIFGAHNKPSGSYTGNGDATERIINTGGIGSFVMIRSAGGIALVTSVGAICGNGSALTGLASGAVKFADGVLTIKSNDGKVNSDGRTYYYQVL